MLDRKDLLHKYGKFKGLDSVNFDFDPVNNPSINPSILLQHHNANPDNVSNTVFNSNENSGLRTPSLPNIKTQPRTGENDTHTEEGYGYDNSLLMSKKIHGKNVRTRNVNTCTILNPIFTKFSRMNLESDRYFYPNPDILIHPLKEHISPKKSIKRISEPKAQKFAQNEVLLTSRI
jgi:hypothetical protein